MNCSSSDKGADTAAGTGGTSGAQGGAGAGGNTSTVFSLIQKSYGRFFVKLNPASSTLGTSASTDVSGVVKDGADPLAYVETAVTSGSGCTLYKLTAPSCANANSGSGCDVSTQTCTGTDTCSKIPTRKNVGTVTVSGIETKTGTTPITLTAVSNSYSLGGDIEVVYPGFAEGAAIKVSASGGDYSAFDITAKGVKQLALGATSYVASPSNDLTFTWTAPGSASDARIQATVNVSHHGGSKGYIACDVADTGSLTIPKAQIAALIEMGVAGYPTLTVIRRSTGTASVGAGQVLLSVESSVSPDFSVEGYTSCDDNSACTGGKTCNTDLKLCQ